MRPVTLTRSLSSAVADGIAQAQAVGAGASMTLNGSLVVAGVAQLGAQRQVIMASGANVATVVFTITGTDQSGNTITDTITGISNSTVASTLNFLTVTSITASATTGANTVTAGTNGVGASQAIPLDIYLDPFNVSLFLDVSGTVNTTVQYTGDSDVLTSPGPFTWFDHADLTGETADAVGTIISTVTAVRLLTNSGTGSVEFTVLQAGAAL
jgi:hypothetical protein